VLPLLRAWKAAQADQAGVGRVEERDGTDHPQADDRQPSRDGVTLEALPEGIAAGLDALAGTILAALAGVHAGERERAERQIEAIQQIADAQVRAEHDRASALIAATQAEAARQMEDAQASETEVTAALTEALARVEALTGDLMATQAGRDALGGKADALADQLAQALHRADTAEQDRDRVAGDLAQLQRRLAEVEWNRDREAGWAAQEINQLRSDLEKERQRVEALHGRLEGAVAAQARAETRIEALVEQLAARRDDIGPSGSS
jgi:chromosome segregation ATPase